MNKIASIGIASVLASFLFSNIALAKEVHTSTALEHATAAANATDAAAVGTHASEALKHIEPAKTAHKPHPEMVKHVEAGEVHLKAAVEEANKGNATAAAHHAHEAATHLEAADK